MIVFTNGVFDMFHSAHEKLLEFCAEIAGSDGIVIVGINDDESVRRLKGPSRPHNPLSKRMNDVRKFLELRRIRSRVHSFAEGTPAELMERVEYEIDVVVKGGDYRPEDVVGFGKYDVKIFPFIKGISTTRILRKIKS